MTEPSALPDLLSASYDEIKAGLESFRFTSVDLTLAYLARIQEVNPTLRAVLELNAYAVLEAAHLDTERRAGKLRGHLHGLPILVKDSIASDKPDQTYMNTTAGSYALYGSMPSGGATIITRLKEAGAIILGKTNLSEWNNYRSDDADPGWSARGGQTLGAYYEKQNPSGSSSGSAVAASMGLAIATIAGETCGSLIMPSCHNNVVGIKPTPGLVSRKGVVPASSTLDTIGPMAVDVRTCAVVLQALVGKDPKDPLTCNNPSEAVPDYLAACRKDALKIARVGVPTKFLELQLQDGAITSVALEKFYAMLPILRNYGATVIEDVQFSELDRYMKEVNARIPVDAEAPQLLEKYFDQLKYNPSGVKTTTDLLNFTASCPAEEVPDRDMSYWQRWVDEKLNTDSPEYLKVLESNAYLGGEGTVTGAMKRENLDCIIVPSTCYRLAGIGGLPMITVPCGFSSPGQPLVPNKRGTTNRPGPNLPHGLGFIGSKFSEERLISLAYSFEQATHIRNDVQPIVKPTTQLKDIMRWYVTPAPHSITAYPYRLQMLIFLLSAVLKEGRRNGEISRDAFVVLTGCLKEDY